jgi:hypothetical protein
LIGYGSFISVDPTIPTLWFICVYDHNNTDQLTSASMLRTWNDYQSQSRITLLHGTSSFFLQLRREKISERMRQLQALVPHHKSNDKATMLGEIIEYIKFMQLQVHVSQHPRLIVTRSFPKISLS